jgi:hypothetical protein
MRSFSNKDDEARRLGRALLATLAGILITIVTVSSITVIPVVYWSIAGLGVAYAQMARTQADLDGGLGERPSPTQVDP